MTVETKSFDETRQRMFVCVRGVRESRGFSLEVEAFPILYYDKTLAANKKHHPHVSVIAKSLHKHDDPTQTNYKNRKRVCLFFQGRYDCG